MNTHLGWPLHKAVIKNDEALLSTLLESNVDINHPDPFGDTALHTAISYQRSSIVNLLLANNPNVNVIGFFGYTPLLLAAKTGRFNIVKDLIARGADVRHKDQSGRTALHLICAGSRDTMIMEILLLHGAYVNEQDSRGQTALHLAVQSRFSSNDNLIKDLLEWGASMFTEDIYGVTPLQLAHDRVITRYTFGKHIHKLDCANLNVKINSKLDIRMFPWCSWRKMCSEEFKRMEMFKCGKVSLSQLFSMRNDPAFLDNSKVMRAFQSFLQSFALVCSFPIYSSLIKVMFVRGQQRLSLLSSAQKFEFTVKEIFVPNEIKRMIFSYLNDEDLKSVIRAGQENIIQERPSELYPWFFHYIYS